MSNKSDIILQKLANAIIANESKPCQGRLIICLFLYKYSEYRLSRVYADIATIFLKESFLDAEKTIVSRQYYPIFEMGIGLIRLLANDCIEDSAESEILCKIDKIAFSDNMNIKSKDIYSPTMYILYRLKYYPRNFDRKYYRHFISKMLSSKDNVLSSISRDPLSLCLLLNLFVYLRYELKETSCKYNAIIERIILLLQKCEREPLFHSKMVYYGILKAFLVVPLNTMTHTKLDSLVKMNKQTVDERNYYTDSYIMGIYNINSSPLTSKQYKDLEDGIKNSYYDTILAPQKLAGVGINILNNKKMLSK